VKTKWHIKLNTKGLLNYVKEGKEAKSRVYKALNIALNVGRKIARRTISSEFQVRTGFLRRQARRIGTKVVIKKSEVKGRITPLPRLLNIFEEGATLTQGRGYLQPRPVVRPASLEMKQVAIRELEAVLARFGKR
jgi:hypothetical protein